MKSAQLATASSLWPEYPALTPVEALEQGFTLAPGELGVMALAADWRQTVVYGEEQNRHGINVGEIGLMVRFEEGSELTELPPLFHLPNSPRWLKGVVNLHGRLIPVFDLLRFLNLERALETKQMLLVLGHDADAAGFIIDGLPQRLRWSDEEQTEVDLAPKLLEPHVRASCLIDDKVWFDLNLSSLLDALEASLN